MSELLDRNKIKENKIKAVEVTITNNVNEPSLTEYFEEYDKEGNVRLNLFYDSKGRLMRRTSYHYDLKGNLSRKMYFDITTKEIVREDFIYKDDKLIEVRINNGDNTKHNLITYDAAGNVRENMKCDASGGLVELTKHLYGGSGELTGKVVYDAFGKIISRTINNFRANGVKAKTITYRGKGDLQLIENFDKKGRLEEIIDHGMGVDGSSLYPDLPEDAEENSSPAPYRIEVNEHGDMLGAETIEEISPAPGNEFVTRHIFDYDDNDNCTSEIIFDARGKELYKITQKYDSRNNRTEYKIEDSPDNWIKTESTYDDKGLLTEERIYSAESDPGRIRKYTYTFYE